MEQTLEKRIEELSARCERQSMVTATGFLTMAEQMEVAVWAKRLADVTLHMDGGDEFCERKCAFFLPYWMDEADFDVSGSGSATSGWWRTRPSSSACPRWKGFSPTSLNRPAG